MDGSKSDTIWLLSNKEVSSLHQDLPREKTLQHPLVQSQSTKNKSTPEKRNVSQKKVKQIFSDPLSTSFEGIDPLNAVRSNTSLLQPSQHLNSQTEEIATSVSNVQDLWPKLRISIFQTHSSRQYIQNVSLLFQSTHPDLSQASTSLIKSKMASVTETERIQMRLQSLNLNKENKGADYIVTNQDKLIQNLITLKTDICEGWKSDQRVKALKAAMQSAKDLGLTCPEPLYPCKFMLITDILNSLGDLVHERLLQISRQASGPKKGNACLEAEETAQNWFSKLSSIRELLPRIYIEAALMKSYCFHSNEEYRSVPKRLINMSRGIGDPLVNTYAKLFVVKNSILAGVSSAELIVVAITDLIATLAWGWSGQGILSAKVTVENEPIESEDAVTLFKPPMIFLFHCLVNLAKEKDLNDVFNLVQFSSGFTRFLVLSAILETFPAHFLGVRSVILCNHIDQCFSEDQQPYELLASLGSLVEQCAIPKDNHVETINLVWKLCVQLKPLSHFLKACTPWVQFAAKNLSDSETEKLLSNILRRLTNQSRGKQDPFYAELLELVRTLLASVQNAQVFFTNPALQGLLGVFQQEGTSGRVVAKICRKENRVSELKKLLECVLQYHDTDFTNLTLNDLLLRLFAGLPDSINALTVHDEKRQISALINAFIRKVSFGRHFDKQLEFYVDARSRFSGLDSVLEFLIQQVCRLQMDFYAMVRGKQTAQSAEFQNAATSYCFITIPSLGCSLTRLKLYVLSGSISIVNGCIGQGNACFVSAINETLEIANDLNENVLMESNSNEILSHISSLVSHLICVPSVNEKQDPFYLFRGLSKASESFSLYPILQLRLCKILMMGIISSGQTTLPYHFQGVEANDSLFEAQSRKKDAEKISSKLLKTVQRIMNNEQNLAVAQEVSQILHIIIVKGDLFDTSTRSTAGSLLLAISKYKSDIQVSAVKKLYEERLAAMRSTSN